MGISARDSPGFPDLLLTIDQHAEAETDALVV